MSEINHQYRSNLTEFHGMLSKHLKIEEPPDIFVMLGSCGHDFLTKGNILSEIDIDKERSKFETMSKRIPEFYRDGHKRKFVLMELDGLKILVQTGKNHLFEGCSVDQITFTPRAIALWGTKYFFVTSLSHSFSENLVEEDIEEEEFNMVAIVKDKIDNTFHGPLSGGDIKSILPKELQGRYYHPNNIFDVTFRIEVRERFQKILKPYQKVPFMNYRLVTDYSFGSPAEIEDWERRTGGISKIEEVFGYSLVPESVAANHMGMIVFALTEYRHGYEPPKIRNPKTIELLLIASEIVRERKLVEKSKSLSESEKVVQ